MHNTRQLLMDGTPGTAVQWFEICIATDVDTCLMCMDETIEVITANFSLRRDSEGIR